MADGNGYGNEPWRQVVRPGYQGGQQPEYTEDFGAAPGPGAGWGPGPESGYEDDPTSHVPQPRRSGPKEAVNGRGRDRPTIPRRRGILGPKAVIAVSATSLLATVAGTGLFTYQHFDKAINTSADGGLVKDSQRPAPAKANAEGQTPMNILLIGSDSRADGNNAYGGGQDAGARSDTTILLHIYADHQHAVGISIPRDLMVDIPACLDDQSKPGGKKSSAMHDQFNAAFAVGDTDTGNVVCTRDTLEAMSGIRIDHTVTVGFEAFSKLTDDIGGVEVCVPNDVKNDVNGDNIALHKGIQTLSGKAALDYVRKRDGLGDGSDIGRTRRQQAFLGSMIKKVQTDGVLNDPTRLSALLNDALQNAQFDKGLGSLSALAGFADSLKGINPAHIQFLTLPGHYRPDYRVDLDPVAAQAIWDHLKSDTLLDGSNAAGNAGAASADTTPTASPTTTATSTAPAIPPADISVKVLNGTSTSGLAGDTTTSLQARGYNAVVSRANTPNIPVTTIVYPSGKEAAANQLAAYFPGAQLKPGGTGSQIVVTLGADFAAVRTKGVNVAPSSGSSVSALPTDIANNSRTADQDICTGITQGFSGGTAG